MDASSKSVLKTVCCTCVSVDRKLFQLCRVPEGVNNLYYLLSYDTEAYKEGFLKGAASLFICWECVSLLRRFCEFRNRVCEAQKELLLISSGQAKYKWKCLSALSTYHKNSFDETYTEPENISCDLNFVDCCPDIEIKTESETDDIPLSDLQLKDKEIEVANGEAKDFNKKRKHVGNNPGAKPKIEKTTYRFSCTECDEHFDNKNKRYKHIQRCHREWFKCATCDKKFAFKSTLNRHEQLHLGPLPRSQCPTCGKLVRRDLWRTHARTHVARTQYACLACDKRFVSRASYEHHLKYTLAHATCDVLKYKCSTCNKGYRSRAELRDHVNYQHLGRTRHKCPVCDKALATRRCVTRHVRRAHHGVKENARDKICQTCGKVFSGAKGLREHEWTHTGERPLACAECGRAFRHSAALAAHRRRLHKMAARARPPVVLADDIAQPKTTNDDNYTQLRSNLM